MKITDAFKGAFLKAADIQHKPKTLTIASIGEEEVAGETKIVVRFEKTDQAWVMNRTNAYILTEEWGDETEDWIGKKVLLKADKTTFSGKLVPCIRVEPVAERSSELGSQKDDDLNV